MKITVRPLTPELWPDFEAVFNAKGCSVARGCWCMFYRESGRAIPASGTRLRDERRRRMKALTAAGPPPGLVGYHGKLPVGWICLGPRAAFARLRRSPVMKPVDDQPVWSIVCFVIPSEYRRQGVASALLAGAVRYARKCGATLLEAYPVDKAEPARDESLWFGTKSMFDAAGFEEVARRKPQRPIVRLRVG
jgi:ribosomal protein S18 acetylase RimI-like enzyme